MFEINEYVVCGDHGVCIITDICTPPIAGVDKERKYYVLRPLSSDGRTIYTPVDNEKVTMRKILTEQEAYKLINIIPSLDIIWVDNEKFREDNYKKALRSYKCEEWIKIIKTLYLRKEKRLSEGKSVTSTDNRYLKTAEAYLYGELSLSLGIPIDEVENFITQRVEELEVMKVLGDEESEL